MQFTGDSAVTRGIQFRQSAPTSQHTEQKNNATPKQRENHKESAYDGEDQPTGFGGGAVVHNRVCSHGVNAPRDASDQIGAFVGKGQG